MPTFNGRNDWNVPVVRYAIPLCPWGNAPTCDPVALENLKQRRKTYTQTHEYLLNIQKEFQKNKEYDKAKALKDEINHQLRLTKTAQIVVDYFEKGVLTKEMPIEYADLLDYEFNKIYMDGVNV